MFVKSLLLGSAAALMSISSVNAADVVIAPEPEKVEYVRVCDAYGAGYFYIPGTETCIKIHGMVRLITIAGEEAGSGSKIGGWKNASRFALRVSTATETELGTLKSYSEGRFNWLGSPSGTHGKYGTQSESAGMKYAYIDLGGFQIGLNDSTFLTLTDYLGGVLNDDVVSGGSYTTAKIAYTFKADNGLSATLSLESGGGDSLGYKAVEVNGKKVGGTNAYTIDGYVPHVVGGVKFVQGWGSIAAVAAYDSVIEEWAGKLRGDLKLGDKFSIWGQGAYSTAETDNQNFGQWGGKWAVWGGAAFKATDKATFNAQAAYEDWGKTAVTANVIYTLVPGFSITPEVSYTKWSQTHYRRTLGQVKDNAVQGMIRFQRSF